MLRFALLVPVKITPAPPPPKRKLSSEETVEIEDHHQVDHLIEYQVDPIDHQVDSSSQRKGRFEPQDASPVQNIEIQEEKEEEVVRPPPSKKPSPPPPKRKVSYEENVEGNQVDHQEDLQVDSLKRPLRSQRKGRFEPQDAVQNIEIQEEEVVRPHPSKKPRLISHKEQTLEELFICEFNDPCFLFNYASKFEACSECLKPAQELLKCSGSCGKFYHKDCFSDVSPDSDTT